jgi:hypothetical protein
MLLQAIATNKKTQGKLIYVSQDLSFDTKNRKDSIGASILINDINIEFSDKNEAVSVWGLCPQSSWKEANIKKPFKKVGKIKSFEKLTPGISIRQNPSDQYWPVLFDQRSGWLYLGEKITNNLTENIEFIEGCVVGLQDGKIMCLWLKPEIY